MLDYLRWWHHPSCVTPTSFITKWSKVALTERSACHQHFLDLCELVGHPKPVEVDPTGIEFCFEKGADKLSGGEGWADVWKKGYFAFEYKGRFKDLAKAYQQLAQYRESLENPPLLVVCDMDRIEVHTNFTGTAKKVIALSLGNLIEPSSLEVLRNVFWHPERLRPGTTSEAITTTAASKMALIAVSLGKRMDAEASAKGSTEPFDHHLVARFLDRLVFCMFAEDIELLPDQLFTKVVTKSRGNPSRFLEMTGLLFEIMAKGGTFGFDVVPHFNGNLFDGAPVLSLNEEEIEMVYQASIMDWSAIDPSIFGTLFERGLDPDKRAMLGAHYTSRADIETLVEPVVMTPLRSEWKAIRSKIEGLLAKRERPDGGELRGGRLRQDKSSKEADAIAVGFLERLGRLRILDPACGSGNFLYVALQKIKDLEKEVNTYLDSAGRTGFLPVVGPWQFLGIEMNAYAAELAQMTLWIGYLQWTRANGYGIPDSPVLRKLDNITCDDAILRFDEAGTVYEPQWPNADFIIGNPPFLGDKLMRGQLGNAYVEILRGLFDKRIPGQSDLCCYWFEKTRHQIEVGTCQRAGLLATQGIRGGANREVLKRINHTGGIFFAVSDREWVLDGAMVHVSIVGFDGGSDRSRTLDGKSVSSINVSLTSTTDLTQSKALAANRGIGFIGTSMHGPFDLEETQAMAMLESAGNPNEKPNSDGVRPILNAQEITNRASRRWVVAFDPAITWEAAAEYQMVAQFILAQVKPIRDNNHRKSYRERWWIHGEARPAMQSALRPLSRFLTTPRVSKHRVFVWVAPEILPSDATVAFARSDDYFFGIMHSRFHELWALAQGTQLREKESGFRYTPTTCFENFPFPTPNPIKTIAVAEAAVELNRQRELWLNPPEWMESRTIEFPGSVKGPWAQYIDPKTVNAKSGTGLVKYPRMEPADANCAIRLKRRSLTNLYNERPQWLANAHKSLDAAVAAAYGWQSEIKDAEVLDRLLALNSAS